MRLTFASTVTLIGLTFSCLAQELPTGARLPTPPDKEKVSYALGMRLGLQLKHADADVDADAIARAIKDILEGRPTQLQESDLKPLFTQAQAYGLAKQSSKNLAEGAAFLAKTAREPDVTALPDGLQYKVLQEGTGKTPETNDTVIVKYRDTLIDGTEIDHLDHFRCRVNMGIKGWQEAIQRMKVGSQWQIYVPADLAYGHEGMRQIGPDSTLILDMELLAIEPPQGPVRDQTGAAGSGHMGHPLAEGALAPTFIH
jgi:FKBP-type peptidyl-prolyl cis-trans isomerase